MSYLRNKNIIIKIENRINIIALMKICTKRTKLCDNDDCEICFEKSFASHSKSKYWSDKNIIKDKKKTKKIKPRDVFKSTSKKYLFDCDKCSHEFKTALEKITNKKDPKWCPYCVNKKLCDNNDCKICFDKSFASHPKSEYWSEENYKIPREVFKGSQNKYLFNCDKCSHQFETILNSITSGSWCPYCANQRLCKNDCDNCFKKSFASHEKSKYWSKKNEIEEDDDNMRLILPREVFLHSNKKYLFNCCYCFHEFKTVISHISRNRWCLFCANQKLCKDEDCKICFEKSFASHEKSRYWSDKNEKKPREVSKGTHAKYLFNCDKCSHNFETAIYSIVSGAFCPYCCLPPQKLCDIDCKECYNKSFASHEKSEYWSSKNNKKPKEVFKSSNNNYLFNCNKCNNEFKMSLNHIMAGNWCPKCNESKLEKKASKYFDKYEIKYEPQMKFNDLKNKQCLPFDFYIPEINALIEFDGIQHFEYRYLFHRKKENFNKRVITDIKKNNYAIEKNYNLLRISYLELPFVEKYLDYFINRVKYSEQQVVFFSNPKLYKKTYLFKK